MSNGQLPASKLAPIPGGRLAKPAARAWNDMGRYLRRRYGVSIRPAGDQSSYRTYNQQVYWRRYWCNRGSCGKAAPPGTSNHGWGNAVDIATPRMAELVRAHGMRFGWSWDEGRRAGEWWHFRYVGGYVPPKRKPDPLRHLTAEERRWVREYVKLRKARKKLRRRAALKRRIVARRRAIWREAQKSGWNVNHRERRWRILSAVTK